MTRILPPPAPEPGAALPACHTSAETLTLLAQRRSTLARVMTGPGPDTGQRDALIRLAARVPDHGKLFPWRFITFEGEARARFGEILEARLRDLEPDAPPERFDLERNRFTRAPLVIAVISEVTANHKIPEWEQILSAGAVCQNLLIAASAMGFAAQWLTEWYAYDRLTGAALGLAGGERVAGFIYIGTASEAPSERPRTPARVTAWSR
ncbi:nitroreductase [Alkalicaulis satelles]|uniref:Putative NAD(P)H nitroreductase n=1 Tax=Alkalicaulis satelles TaxID=2609175 RepID=A0A5M6ZCN7_9PROT|nr:nitroreductase [Alkalicaulis satelles]KAA5801664.1 nitroreductase [Alkalicaulis satelles]